MTRLAGAFQTVEPRLDQGKIGAGGGGVEGTGGNLEIVQLGREIRAVLRLPDLRLGAGLADFRTRAGGEPPRRPPRQIGDLGGARMYCGEVGR